MQGIVSVGFESSHGKIHHRPIQSAKVEQPESLRQAHEVREAFKSFVGETFFGQMIKAMRSTQGKPAYFHGGQAEEVFRGQLDQTLAQELTIQSADQIADPMFQRHFPQLAEQIDLEKRSLAKPLQLSDLQSLSRR